MTRRQFQLAEGPDGVWFPGYDVGTVWNGWACPRVSIATAKRLVAYLQRICCREEDDRWEWLADAKAIRVTTADGGVALLEPREENGRMLLDVSHGYTWIWRGHWKERP